jgi:hypothetical protein
MNARRTSPVLGMAVCVAASVTVAVAGLLLVRHFGPAAWLRANNDVAGNYLQTLGTIYAVLLAFVVFVVWQQHNDARQAIESEANELFDLERTLRAFPEPIHRPALEATAAYRQAVVTEEWTAMAAGRTSPQAAQAIEAIWAVVQAIEPRNPRQELLCGEALARFNDLSDARVHRLHFAHLRLPPALWTLLVGNGGFVVGSMWLFGLESALAHALMTAALTGSIAFVLCLIADLDNPFWGAWRVTCAVFERGPGQAHGARSTHSSLPDLDTC